MTNFLEDAWISEICPIISGIIFPSGKIDWINVREVYVSPGKYKYFLTPGPSTSLKELEDKGELKFTSITALCENFCEKQRLKAYCGEGGYGGDGFVAAFDLDSEKIMWVAFFDSSNPFVKVEIQEGYISARSNHGNFWNFPISSPKNLIVN